MITKFKAGQWISKSDVLKLGEVRWEKFREKYRSEHATTRDFTSCGLIEDHHRYDRGVFVWKDGDLAWDDVIGKAEDQISYETILQYIGEKEMKEFDLKTMPWFIRVNSEQESKAAQEWLFEQGVSWCSGDFQVKNTAFIKYLTNFTMDRVDPDGFMWMTLPNEYVYTPDKEIKLSFSLKADKVEFPSVKSEQEIQLDKLKEKIAELNKQAEELEKVIKGEM